MWRLSRWPHTIRKAFWRYAFGRKAGICLFILWGKGTLFIRTCLSQPCDRDTFPTFGSLVSFYLCNTRIFGDTHWNTLCFFTYSCHKCQKFYIDVARLQSHIYTHPTNRVCPDCGKCFMYARDLTVHMRVHISDRVWRMYECYLCKSKFKTTYSLQKHMDLHVDSKIFYWISQFVSRC